MDATNDHPLSDAQIRSALAVVNGRRMRITAEPF